MKKKPFQLLIAAALMMAACLNAAHAAPTYISGKIFHYTVTNTGLLIRIEGAVVPDNCSGTPFGWIMIAAEKKHMIAGVLASIGMNRLNVTVYTDGLVNGYCQANQLDFGTF